MNKIILSILIFSSVLIFNKEVFADQNPEWVQGYNSAGNRNDEGRCVKKDAQGNVYVCGTSVLTSDFSNIITFLNKYSSTGILLWQRTVVDNVSNSAWAFKMFIDGAGNICLTGSENSDLMLVKYNSQGTLLWKRNYDKLLGLDLFVTSDGNVYITGSKTDANVNYCVTLKYSYEGTLLWVDSRTQGDISYGQNIRADGNGNVFVLGEFDNFDHSYPYILRYNSTTGQLLTMVKVTDTYMVRCDGGLKMELDNNGNIYITASGVFSNGGGSDILTAKYNTSGQVLWKKRFDGASSNIDEPRDLYVDPASGLVYVCGRSWTSNLAGFDFITIKYLTTGVEQWHKIYNGSGSDTDYAQSISVDQTGSVYVTGRTQSGPAEFDITTIKYNLLGLTLWSTVYSASNRDLPVDMEIDDAGSLYITGSTKRFLNNDNDMILVKYASTIGIQPLSNSIPEKYNLSQNYPNPFNPSTNINFSITKAGNVKLIVFDVIGKVVSELVNGALPAGSYKADFDSSHLSSGVYFYKLVAGDYSEVKRMVLIK
jgi:hypothetical protein